MFPCLVSSQVGISWLWQETGCCLSLQESRGCFDDRLGREQGGHASCSDVCSNCGNFLHLFKLVVFPHGNPGPR